MKTWAITIVVFAVVVVVVSGGFVFCVCVCVRCSISFLYFSIVKHAGCWLPMRLHTRFFAESPLFPQTKQWLIFSWRLFFFVRLFAPFLCSPIAFYLRIRLTFIFIFIKISWAHHSLRLIYLVDHRESRISALLHFQFYRLNAASFRVFFSLIIFCTHTLWPHAIHSTITHIEWCSYPL